MDISPNPPPPALDLSIFRELFLSIPDGIAIHHILRDASGKVIDTEVVSVNAAARWITHTEGQDVYGRHNTTRVLVKPLSGHSALELYTQAADTGKPVTEDVIFIPENAYYRITLFRVAPDYVAISFHEITDFVLAEGTQQSIFNSVSDAVFVHDAQSGALVDLNRQAEELAGKPRQTLLGLALLPGEPAEFAQARADFLRRAQAGETEMQLLTPVNTKSGQKWYDLRARVADAPGNRRLVLLIHDVTELQIQMQALVESQERYRVVSEVVSDFAFAITVDQNGKSSLDWITDAFITITGFSEEESWNGVRSHSTAFYFKLIHPDDHAQVQSAWKRMIEKGSAEYDYRLVGKDGTIKWVRSLVKATPIPGNQGYKVIGAVKDISDRVQAENTYLSIFNAVNDSIFVHEIETARIVDLNIQAALMMGYPRDEIIGKVRLPHETYELARQRVSLIHRAALGQIFDDVSIYLGPDGQQHWIESRFKVGIIGGEQRVVCIARDVTERKLAIEALKQSEERYRFISSSTSDFAFLLNCDENKSWSVSWVTDAFSRLTGYTIEDINSALEIFDLDTFNFAFQFVHADDLWKIKRNIANQRAPGSIAIEFRLIRKNRTWINVRGYFKPIFEGKRLAGITGALQDITDQVQAEKNYRAIFEAAIDAILVLDAQDGSVLDANQKGDLLLVSSWSENAEILALDKIFVDVSRDEFLNTVRTAAIEGDQEREWQARISSHQLTRYNVRMQPVDLGGERRVLAVLRDLNTYKYSPPRIPSTGHVST